MLAFLNLNDWTFGSWLMLMLCTCAVPLIVVVAWFTVFRRNTSTRSPDDRRAVRQLLIGITLFLTCFLGIVATAGGVRKADDAQRSRELRQLAESAFGDSKLGITSYDVSKYGDVAVLSSPNCRFTLRGHNGLLWVSDLVTPLRPISISGLIYMSPDEAGAFAAQYCT